MSKSPLVSPPSGTTPVPSRPTYLPSPSSPSPPASRLLFFASFPICSLLVFMFSSPLLSVAIASPFRSPGRSNPGPLCPRMFQSRGSAPQLFQSSFCSPASPDVPCVRPLFLPRLFLPLSDSLFSCPPSPAFLIRAHVLLAFSCRHPLPKSSIVARPAPCCQMERKR